MHRQKGAVLERRVYGETEASCAAGGNKIEVSILAQTEKCTNFYSPTWLSREVTFRKRSQLWLKISGIDARSFGSSFSILLKISWKNVVRADIEEYEVLR